MAKKATKSEAFQKLKDDLKAGDIGCAYIFHGEESYLREYYLGEMRKTLVPAGFEEFNYHRMEGKDLNVQTIAEMAEAMPMIKLMGRAYSLSHFIFGSFIKVPQITMVRADTPITQTGIKPEVGESSPNVSSILAAGSQSRETSQNTKPRNAAIIPINRALEKVSAHF